LMSVNEPANEKLVRLRTKRRRCPIILTGKCSNL
jgi:hypothetical protein